MNTIPLEPIPNQSFSTTVEGITYKITLRTAQNATLASIESGGRTLITNALCVPGGNILPYPAYKKSGNFRFMCQDNQYPYYENFGKTCFLAYIPEAEL